MLYYIYRMCLFMELDKQEVIRQFTESPVALAVLTESGTVFTIYGDEVSMQSKAEAASILLNAIARIHRLVGKKDGKSEGQEL